MTKLQCGIGYNILQALLDVDAGNETKVIPLWWSRKVSAACTTVLLRPILLLKLHNPEQNKMCASSGDMMLKSASTGSGRSIESHSAAMDDGTNTAILSDL